MSGDIAARLVTSNLTIDNVSLVDNFDQMSITSEDSQASAASSSPFILQKLLECGSCNGFLSQPIYVCEGGHNVCPNCHNHLINGAGAGDIIVNCNACNLRITKTQNVVLEKVLGLLQSSCPNSKDGCGEIVGLSNWEEHLKNCSYGEVTCNVKEFKKCTGIKMPCSSYFNHLKKIHRITGVSTNTITIMQNTTTDGSLLVNPIPWDTWPMHYIEAFGHVFLTGTEINYGRITWWVSIIGSDKEGQDFVGTVTLSNKTKDIALSWTGPVHSFRTNLDEILAIGTLSASAQDFKLFQSPYELTASSPQNVEGQQYVSWYISFTVAKKVKQVTVLPSPGPKKVATQVPAAPAPK